MEWGRGKEGREGRKDRIIGVCVIYVEFLVDILVMVGVFYIKDNYVIFR